ncbi:hypothetical protein RJ640_005936 [Escallonia rubra]|uniref:Uncharacterized protein n=1 Tax=Escallonia rubra TaxID=112253 RepID=A0AA88UDQ3_9ASTE|nr:hypothetical protein RJ640_005936 [Escallonia rubra]
MAYLSAAEEDERRLCSSAAEEDGRRLFSSAAEEDGRRLCSSAAEEDERRLFSELKAWVKVKVPCLCLRPLAKSDQDGGSLSIRQDTL